MDALPEFGDRGYRRVGIVILAAGASTRLGSPKQLVSFRGQSLLRHAAQSAVETRCRPVVAVLGARSDRIRSEIKDLHVHPTVNLYWRQGISSSIRAGLQALDERASGAPVDAAVIMLCDQPFVTANTINTIVAGYKTSGKPIVASEYGGTLGVPALFARALFPELLGLADDAGAKAIIKKYEKDVERIAFAEGAIDIDTREDLEALRNMPGGANEKARPDWVFGQRT